MTSACPACRLLFVLRTAGQVTCSLKCAVSLVRAPPIPPAEQRAQVNGEPPFEPGPGAIGDALRATRASVARMLAAGRAA